MHWRTHDRSLSSQSTWSFVVVLVANNQSRSTFWSLCRKCQMLTPSCSAKRTKSAPWLASLLLCQNMSYLIVVTPREIAGLSALTSSTAQGGGGSFKNRKPIGEIGCCESGIAERIHWWTERCLRSPLFLSLALTIYLPTCLSSMYLSIYRSIYLSLSLFHLFTYLPIYLSTYVPMYLSTYLSIYLSLSFICLSV